MCKGTLNLHRRTQYGYNNLKVNKLFGLGYFDISGEWPGLEIYPCQDERETLIHIWVFGVSN